METARHIMDALSVADVGFALANVIAVLMSLEVYRRAKRWRVDRTKRSSTPRSELARAISVAALVLLLVYAILGFLNPTSSDFLFTASRLIAFPAIYGIAIAAGSGLWAVLQQAEQDRIAFATSVSREAIEELAALLKRLDDRLELPRQKWFLNDGSRETFEPNTRKGDSKRYSLNAELIACPEDVVLKDCYRWHGVPPTWLAHDVLEPLSYAVELLGPINERAIQLRVDTEALLADFLFFAPLVLGYRLNTDGTIEALGKDQVAKIRIFWTIMASLHDTDSDRNEYDHVRASSEVLLLAETARAARHEFLRNAASLTFDGETSKLLNEILSSLAGQSGGESQAVEHTEMLNYSHATLAHDYLMSAEILQGNRGTSHFVDAVVTGPHRLCNNLQAATPTETPDAAHNEFPEHGRAVMSGLWTTGWSLLLLAVVAVTAPYELFRLTDAAMSALPEAMAAAIAIPAATLLAIYGVLAQGTAASRTPVVESAIQDLGDLELALRSLDHALDAVRQSMALNGETTMGRRGVFSSLPNVVACLEPEKIWAPTNPSERARFTLKARPQQAVARSIKPGKNDYLQRLDSGEASLGDVGRFAALIISNCDSTNTACQRGAPNRDAAVAAVAAYDYSVSQTLDLWRFSRLLPHLFVNSGGRLRDDVRSRLDHARSQLTLVEEKFARAGITDVDRYLADAQWFLQLLAIHDAHTTVDAQNPIASRVRVLEFGTVPEEFDEELLPLTSSQSGVYELQDTRTLLLKRVDKSTPGEPRGLAVKPIAPTLAAVALLAASWWLLDEFGEQLDHSDIERHSEPRRTSLLQRVSTVAAVQQASTERKSLACALRAAQVRRTMSVSDFECSETVPSITAYMRARTQPISETPDILKDLNLPIAAPGLRLAYPDPTPSISAKHGQSKRTGHYP